MGFCSLGLSFQLVSSSSEVPESRIVVSFMVLERLAFISFEVLESRTVVSSVVSKSRIVVPSEVLELLTLVSSLGAGFQLACSEQGCTELQRFLGNRVELECS